jgi:hypothetical protein
MTPLKRTVRRHAASVAASVPGLRSLHHWEQTRVRPHLHAYLRDRANCRRHGPAAPLFGERLWIDPLAIDHAVVHGSSLWDSGRVAYHDFTAGRLDAIEDDPVLRAAIAHWRDGVPWEESGEVERMEEAIRLPGPIKGCRTRADILARCSRLDEIFATIQREGRVRPQAELDPGVFREAGGIGVHIGPGGAPIRAANGRHRFAMARILRLRSIPVRIGLVHHSALPMLDDLRRPPGTHG